MSNEIRTYDLATLEKIVSDYGQPKFRAKQIHEWLHSHNASSYDEMTNLPKDLRMKLADDHPLYDGELLDKQESEDGSRKYIIELEDGKCIESVGIISGDNTDRLTVCFSTQVGCPMECSFCATGKEGFARNLTADEILNQVITVGNDFKSRVNNVVAMGQGEPFLNYEELMKALRAMNTDEGLMIGARHITLSTSGIIDGIYRFAEEPEQFRLAVSLHSAIQTTRNELMPRLAGQPLVELRDALLNYTAKKGRRITFEYMLIDGVNDDDKHLRELIDFLHEINAHVNLLSYNVVENIPYKNVSRETIRHWEEILTGAGIRTSYRKSKGADIAGACGQLKATRHQRSLQTTAEDQLHQ